MSDLSPVILDTLEQLKQDIALLRRGGSRESPKPHKLLLLLAVLDLADEGLLKENRIYFDDRLILHFEKHFRQYAETGDWLQPGPPFFHLRSAGFWRHKIREGRESQYSALNTSGGGTKRIIENIEYAYFSSDAVQVIGDPLARSQLRNFIEDQLKQHYSQRSEEGGINTDRIGTVFHESFSLSRPSIAAVISVLRETELSGGLHSTLRAKTHLGTNYIKAMPQYARGCGLLTMDNHLTLFGDQAVEHDPLLERLETQWLMHYFMSAPQGPGPLFWHEFIGSRFRYGDQFTKNSLASQLIDFIQETEAKSLSAASANSTANAFIGTYEKDDGFGRLGIVEATDDDKYRVTEPEPVPLRAFTIALLDFWQHQYPNRLTINLDELYEEGGLTSIFMIGAGRINRYLHSLQQEGVVDVFRVAPPYQVALLNPSLTEAFAKLYDDDGD